MEPQTSDKDITTFWIKVYFNLEDGYIRAAVKRAYRDFNRTLESLPKKEGDRKILRDIWIEVFERKLKEVLSSTFPSQNEFDVWHQSTCFLIRTANENYPLSQGQAQKWINMTLKYLFAMGETNVPGIKNNYPYFHIPLDRIIIGKLYNFGLGNFDGKPWSKINDYDSYYNYQKDIRRLYKDRIPMDVEFELFNSSYNLSVD